MKHNDGQIKTVGKLLVTGASGFLGWNLCQIAHSAWEIYGTTWTNTVQIPGITTVKLDLRNWEQSQQTFAQIRPDAVIHLAAASKPNYCQTHPDESYLMNVSVSEAIASWCAESAIPLVFTSTDLVFDGLNPPYHEGDRPSPICIYGEHKAIAEQRVLQRHPQAVVCRMPLMFGEASPTSGSFLQGFLQALRQGETLRLFADEYRSVTSAKTASQGLLLALEQAPGLLHLGGKEVISRYDFGLLMAEVFDLPQELIQPCQQQDVKMSAPRPPNVTLDSSRAYSLGYNPRSLREELFDLKKNT